ncbi:MAG TPA: antibiotic biosynthesis monooxygenase [Rhodobacteraceae bacterium]|jgi:heme-degrading monooxygenase HmoA|nr:antibiotic biosynthesis monooxygenase [Paracoccaceae bacterium]
MFLATNRFKVLPNRTDAFEKMWENRNSDLPKLEGFVEFRLMRGPECDGYVLYLSHTFWENEDNFKTWTQSKEFGASHAKKRAGQSEPMMMGGPQFEGFQHCSGVKQDGSKF